ncbi:MAG: hypothetical protein H6825_07505 [Planctomycetes bacterium]|nr:hypothetical protein [Planctomycetota bacterium]
MTSPRRTVTDGRDDPDTPAIQHVIAPRAFSPIRSVMNHATVFVAVFAVMALIGLMISVKAGGKYYLAEATIFVSPSTMKTLEEDTAVQQQARDYGSFINQQIYTITRFDVLTKVVEKLHESGLWQRPDESVTRAVERLHTQLLVEWVKGSYLISVGLAGDEPDGLAEIVNTVVDAYLKVQRDEYIWAPAERIDWLTGYRKEIQTEIEAKGKMNGRLASELGLTSFNSDEKNPHQTSLIEVTTALNEARLTLLASEAELAALEGRRQRDAEDPNAALVERERILPPSVGEGESPVSGLTRVSAPKHPLRVSIDTTLAALNQARLDLIGAENDLSSLLLEQPKLEALELESQARLLYDQQQAARLTSDPLVKQHGELLAALAGLRKDHPGYAVTQAQLQTLDLEMDTAAEQAIERISKELAQRRLTEASEARTKAESRVFEAKQLVKGYEAEYDRLAAELARTINDHDRSYIMADIERDRLYVERLEDEYDRLREEVSDFVTKFQSGRTLELEIERNRQTLRDVENRIEYFKVESEGFGFARSESVARQPDEPQPSKVLKYFLAFLVLAGFVALTSCVVAENVDTVIHGPDEIQRALGFLPVVSIPEWTTPALRHEALDQIRRLALFLDRERLNAGVRIVTLTSVARGGGTTTLLEALAKELAALGSRVLTIAANAASEDPADGAPGFSDLLAETCDGRPYDSTQNPAHVPVGRIGGRTLPAVHRLGQVLASTSEGFDLVLVDAPPMLSSSDGELLVMHADMTLLLAAAERDDIAALRNASVILERLDPPVVGVIVDRVVPRITLSGALLGLLPWVRRLLGEQPPTPPATDAPTPGTRPGTDGPGEGGPAATPGPATATREPQPPAPDVAEPQPPATPAPPPAPVGGTPTGTSVPSRPAGDEDTDDVAVEDEPSPHPYDEPAPDHPASRPPGIPRHSWRRPDEP